MTIADVNSTTIKSGEIIEEYLAYVDSKSFPCIAAKAALAKQHVKCMVANHMACPNDDQNTLQFLYSFIDEYRSSSEFYHTAAIIFKEPGFVTEEMFEQMLWKRLQALADLDAKEYYYDKRVCADPSASNFSFSLKEEAFYIIGLHPSSSRKSRQFTYPTLVFNPHAQFEQLREKDKYDKMKMAVRKRDIIYSGSVNPMLEDFGEASEINQYSGRSYDETWQCPLKINHGAAERNTAT
jgi:FPC/CPF motif-containing protein YcgG